MTRDPSVLYQTMFLSLLSQEYQLFFKGQIHFLLLVELQPEALYKEVNHLFHQYQAGKNEKIICEFKSYWVTVASLFISTFHKIFWVRNFSVTYQIRFLFLRFMVNFSFIDSLDVGNQKIDT